MHVQKGMAQPFLAASVSDPHAVSYKFEHHTAMRLELNRHYKQTPMPLD
jgi:hypothetical protein